MSREVARLHFVPIAEIASSSPAEPDWIWAGYVAPGAITLMAGRPKVGKSTLLFAFMAAVGQGRNFCGRPTRRAPIVLLSEERAGTLADKIRKTSWPDGVDVLLHHSAYGVAWEEIIRQAVEHVGADGLLIVDTLPDFAELPADMENAAGAVQTAMRPVQEAAARGCAVLLVAHQRKAAGEHGEAIRGSNALTATVDIVLELERAPGSIGPEARVLKAVSRYGAAPETLVVAQGEGGYEAKGELAGAAAAAEGERIAAELTAMGEATAEELAASSALSKPTVQRHLNGLRAAGRLTRSGDGKKGDPYRWRVGCDSAREIPYGRIASGATGGDRAAADDAAVGGAASDSPRPAASERIESDRPLPGGLDRPASKPNGDADDPMLRALLESARADPRWRDGDGSAAL